MNVGDEPSETRGDGAGDEETGHDLARAVPVDHRPADEADDERRGQGGDVGVADLRRGEAEVLLDGLGEQRREGEPREEGDEEAEPGEVEVDGVRTREREEGQGVPEEIRGGVKARGGQQSSLLKDMTTRSGWKPTIFR